MVSDVAFSVAAMVPLELPNVNLALRKAATHSLSLDIHSLSLDIHSPALVIRNLPIHNLTHSPLIPTEQEVVA